MESTLTNYQLVEENARLKAELKELRLKIAELAANPVHSPTAGTEAATSQGPGSERAQIPWEGVGHTLTKAQLERYSRQILLPSFGVKGTSFAELRLETFPYTHLRQLTQTFFPLIDCAQVVLIQILIGERCLLCWAASGCE